MAQSQYVTRLREEPDEQGQVGRDLLDWPTPIGTWKQGEEINRLETFVLAGRQFSNGCRCLQVQQQALDLGDATLRESVGGQV